MTILKNYLKIDSHGYVSAYVRTSQKPPGYVETILPVPNDITRNIYFYVFVENPESLTLSSVTKRPPASTSVWDPILGTWVDGSTLQDRKDTKWAEFEILMEADATAGVTYNLKEYAADYTTQTRLSMAVQYAATDPLYTIDWESINGTVDALNENDLSAIQSLIVLQDEAARAKGRVKKAEINAAIDDTELDAIVWNL